jgi:hypothetical protein
MPWKSFGKGSFMDDRLVFANYDLDWCGGDDAVGPERIQHSGLLNGR